MIEVRLGRFESTYKELKQRRQREEAERLLRGFESTYKELKQVTLSTGNDSEKRFESTYKELKLVRRRR